MKRLIFSLAAIAITSIAINAKTEVIAHRGHWTADGAAQNSIIALQKADEIGCYGSEFDVWICSDDQIVVNHDHIFDGKVLEDTDSETFTSLRLKNGENMPTLRQYLEAGKKCKTRLILELKNHANHERETVAVAQIMAMVKELRLEDRMEYISFSLHAVKELIKQAPAGTPVYYLNGELSPKELKSIGAAGMDYHIDVIKKHPEWIEESHKLGLKVNVWTVNKVEDMQWFIDMGVDFITTNDPELLQMMLGTTK